MVDRVAAMIWPVLQQKAQIGVGFCCSFVHLRSFVWGLNAAQNDLVLLVMVALGWCLASGLIPVRSAIANGPVLSTGRTRMSEEVPIAKAFGQRFRAVVGKVDAGGFSGQPIKINGQGFLNATTLLASLLLVVVPAACLARVVLANRSASGESQVELDLVEPSEALSIDLEMGLQSFDLQTSCPSNAAGTLQTRSSGECLAPAVDGNAGVFGPQPNQYHIELYQKALETQRSSGSPVFVTACEGHPAVGPCCSCRSTDGLG